MDKLAQRIAIMAAAVNVLAAFVADQILPQLISSDSLLIQNPLVLRLQEHYYSLISSSILVAILAGAAANFAGKRK